MDETTPPTAEDRRPPAGEPAPAPEPPPADAPAAAPDAVPPSGEEPVKMEPLKLRSDRFTAKRFLSIVLDGLLIVLAPVAITVAVGLYQSVKPERVYSNRTPADVGLAYEDVTLTTADGLKLAAWYVPAKTETKGSVLVLHGYPADKGDLLPRSAFLAEKYNLLFVDFRYFGKSEGTMTTVGVREVEDAAAAIAELKRRGMEEIGVYGFSMGAAVALMLLDRTEDVDAVVAEAAYADLRLIAEEPYRYLGPFRRPCAWLTALLARYALGVDVDARSPVMAASRTKKPVLLIHSKNDRVIPFRHAELIRDALKDDPNAEFMFTEGLIHGEPSVDFAQKVQDFFDRRLAASAAGE